MSDNKDNYINSLLDICQADVIKSIVSANFCGRGLVARENRS